MNGSIICNDGAVVKGTVVKLNLGTEIVVDGTTVAECAFININSWIIQCCRCNTVVVDDTPIHINERAIDPYHNATAIIIVDDSGIGDGADDIGKCAIILDVDGSIINKSATECVKIGCGGATNHNDAIIFKKLGIIHIQ